MLMAKVVSWFTRYMVKSLILRNSYRVRIVNMYQEACSLLGSGTDLPRMTTNVALTSSVDDKLRGDLKRQPQISRRASEVKVNMP